MDDPYSTVLHLQNKAYVPT